MRRWVLASLLTSFTFTQCVKPDPGDSTTVKNPADPTQTVATNTATVKVCGTICDALIADYGVPASLRADCVWECASGFKSSPDDCYRLVECIADHTLCSGKDISAECIAKSGACLGTWGLANGSCRGCWQPSRTVHGKQIVTYVSENGSDPRPEDYSNQTIAAHLPGAGGTEYVFPGSGNADGTYVIPNVPGCGVWIQVGTTYTWSGNADVDTSYTYQGRRNAVLAGPGTTFTFQISGMVPWTQNDWFEFFIPQLGWYQGGFWGIMGDNQPPVPDLATSYTWPLGAEGFALPDASQGDVIYFTQLPTKMLADGSLLRTADKTLRVDNFTAQNGVDNPLPVNLTDTVGAVLSAHFDWRRSSYAFAADLHPSSVQAGDPSNLVFIEPDVVALITFPGQANIGSSAELALFQPPFGTADVPPIDLSFTNPYPASWGIDVWAGLQWVVPLHDRVGNSFYGIEIVLGTQPLALSGTNPLAARLGPVKNARVDGQSAFGPIASTSLTPTISWDPPALGTPQRYSVVVQAMSDPKLKRGRSVATFVIPAAAGASGPALRSVTLVPGVLQAGTDYYFRIEAESDADQHVDSAGVVTSEYRP